jgi:NTE family protein
MRQKRLGLALSGGGARGMAHVGVLQVLDEAGLSIACIAGTSAGSLAGAAYAAGYHGPRLAELALGIRWRDIARPSRSRAGMFSFDPLESYLDRLLGECTFADLEIPFAAVAGELESGRAAILRQGRLAPAVRASCSVPGLVSPTEIDGRRLVDGAIANNLPISVARDLGADVVVAVNLHPRPPEPPRRGRQIAMASFLYLLLAAGDDPATADVYLPIPLYGLDSLVRLSQRRELMALGRQVAQDALPAIRAALS